jgi:hypothetical protein
MACDLPGEGGVSQKCVEIVIGRLATDEELRTRFIRDPRATVHQLSAAGLELNPGEVGALLEMSVELLTVLATWVHPRLQKIALKGNHHGPSGDDALPGVET